MGWLFLSLLICCKTTSLILTFRTKAFLSGKPASNWSLMQRDMHIDVAKGIGIFSVVSGHIVTGIASEFMFLFHMPFFFFISGYLHKKN